MMDKFFSFFKRSKKFGLTLSGGGARGYAHIGVLKALEEADLQPDCISGTSMGAVMGAAFASGLTSEELTEIANEMSSTHAFWRYADLASSSKSIFKGQRIVEFFEEKLSAKTFAELSIPTTLVAVDINSSQEVHLSTGSVVEAVRASISVPGIFAPVEINGMCLVDGGLLNNMPVDAARNMGADIVLGVNVGTDPDDGPSIWQALEKRRFLANTFGGMMRVLGDSLDTVMHHQYLHQLEKHPPEILIHPRIPGTVGVVSGYDQAQASIDAGYEALLPVMEELKKLLGR